MSIQEAKDALDHVLKKSRVHLYKPIQIAEILYHDRVVEPLDLLDLETYRSKSKKWRDDMCIALLGRVSTSSSKFQDDLFNAIPAPLLSEMGQYNRTHNGAVEAYIYEAFSAKHSQLSQALNDCFHARKETFEVQTFLSSFWQEAGLRRSLDKIYEIVVYSLFFTLTEALDLTVEISINENKLDLVSEFEDFTKSVMCLDFNHPSYIQNARVYRVGVTNAADRGLDMYSNWGPVIQIKHLSLNPELAENIVSGVSSDKIVIVCKDAEKAVIVSLLTQIGWKSKIQSIITEADLVRWYEKGLRGKYASTMGDRLLAVLRKAIAEEFPSVDETPDILKRRHYDSSADSFWTQAI